MQVLLLKLLYYDLYKVTELIVIDMGNIGQELVKYPNFKNRGFKFVYMFGADIDIIGKKVNNIRIRNVSNLESYQRHSNIDINFNCLKQLCLKSYFRKNFKPKF